MCGGGHGGTGVVHVELVQLGSKTVPSKSDKCLLMFTKPNLCLFFYRLFLLIDFGEREKL